MFCFVYLPPTHRVYIVCSGCTDGRMNRWLSRHCACCESNYIISHYTGGSNCNDHHCCCFFPLRPRQTGNHPCVHQTNHQPASQPVLPLAATTKQWQVGDGASEALPIIYFSLFVFHRHYPRHHPHAPHHHRRHHQDGSAVALSLHCERAVAPRSNEWTTE